MENSKRAVRRQPRGQAMVEYSVISHFMLFAGGVAMLSVYTRLFAAVSTFYESVYTVLESAL